MGVGKAVGAALFPTLGEFTDGITCKNSLRPGHCCMTRVPPRPPLVHRHVHDTCAPLHPDMCCMTHVPPLHTGTVYALRAHSVRLGCRAGKSRSSLPATWSPLEGSGELWRLLWVIPHSVFQRACMRAHVRFH